MTLVLQDENDKCAECASKCIKNVCLIKNDAGDATRVCYALEPIIEQVKAHLPIDLLVRLVSSDEDTPLSEEWLPFVQFMGDVVSAADTDRVIHAGILHHWHNMLFHSDPRFRAAACDFLSNILSDVEHRAKVLAFEGIIRRVVELMQVTFLFSCSEFT